MQISGNPEGTAVKCAKKTTKTKKIREFINIFGINTFFIISDAKFIHAANILWSFKRKSKCQLSSNSHQTKLTPQLRTQKKLLKNATHQICFLWMNCVTWLWLTQMVVSFLSSLVWTQWNTESICTSTSLPDYISWGSCCEPWDVQSATSQQSPRGLLKEIENAEIFKKCCFRWFYYFFEIMYKPVNKTTEPNPI